MKVPRFRSRGMPSKSIRMERIQRTEGPGHYGASVSGKSNVFDPDFTLAVSPEVALLKHLSGMSGLP